MDCAAWLKGSVSKGLLAKARETSSATVFPQRGVFLDEKPALPLPFSVAELAELMPIETKWKRVLWLTESAGERVAPGARRGRNLSREFVPRATARLAYLSRKSRLCHGARAGTNGVEPDTIKVPAVGGKQFIPEYPVSLLSKSAVASGVNRPISPGRERH